MSTLACSDCLTHVWAFKLGTSALLATFGNWEVKGDGRGEVTLVKERMGIPKATERLKRVDNDAWRHKEKSLSDDIC